MCASAQEIFISGIYNSYRSRIMKPVNRWRSRRIESRGNYADYKIRHSAKFDLKKWRFVRTDQIQDGIR